MHAHKHTWYREFKNGAGHAFNAALHAFTRLFLGLGGNGS